MGLVRFIFRANTHGLYLIHHFQALNSTLFVATHFKAAGTSEGWNVRYTRCARYDNVLGMQVAGGVATLGRIRGRGPQPQAVGRTK